MQIYNIITQEDIKTIIQIIWRQKIIDEKNNYRQSIIIQKINKYKEQNKIKIIEQIIEHDKNNMQIIKYVCMDMKKEEIIRIIKKMVNKRMYKEANQIIIKKKYEQNIREYIKVNIAIKQYEQVIIEMREENIDEQIL